MINGMAMIMLAFEAASDIKTSTVSVIRAGIFMVAAIVINVIFKYQSWASMIGGVAVGAILLAYALATQEGIGYGDCFVFMCTGALLGIAKNLRLLFYSMILAVIMGLIVSLFTKKSVKRRVPFLPSIFAAFVIMCIVEAFL